MTSFDVARIVDELQTYLGARARKAYHPHWEQVVLRLNPKEEAQIDLVIVRGKRIYLSRRDRPMPPQPSAFSMLIRKHLMNSRLVAVSQHSFDRIILLEFDTKGGKRTLVVEMFRDGNVLLLDEEGVIIQPLTGVKYAKRTLKRGEKYESPPAQVDPRELTADDLAGMCAESDADLVRTLASRANLAGVYAEAACARAEIDGGKIASDLDNDEVDSLLAGLTSLTDELTVGTGGVVALENPAKQALVDAGENRLACDGVFEEHAIEAAPFALPAYEPKHVVEFATLAEAVDAWKGSHDSSAFERLEQEKATAAIGEKEYSDEGSTLERRLAQQETAIARFEAKAGAQQALGKAIQENWEHVDGLINQTLQAVEQNGWDAVRAQVKKIEWIESLDPALRRMKAYLPDEEGEPEGRVELHLDQTVHQNAQRYFAAGRRQKEKAAGAKLALAETEKQLAGTQKRKAKDEAAGRVRRAKRSKQLWVEKHRWAVVGDGQLLVGGKDAKGNDTVVNKHLTRPDLYFHADLHGAPSCALKLKEGFEIDPNPIPNLPEGVPALRLTQTLDVDGFSQTSIEHAAQMAVVWSRGWAGGGAGATAFWVEPTQVSKTAETGEALARGAWIVRGKRNWLRDLRMEFTLGMAVINGVPLPLTGPHSAVTKWCQRWVRIGTGTVKKEALANRISKATGLVQDDVLAVLPAGNVQILEDHNLLS